MYAIERITEDVVGTKHVAKILIPDDVRDISDHFALSLKTFMHGR